MDHLRQTTCPESLTRTLHCYQLSSVDSLSGPSGYPAQAAQMWFKENKQLPPNPPQPIVPVPYFISNDKTCTRSETILYGEAITCFVVGGEKRLCLPQILNSVLREFSIADINQACAELHIYCSRCSPEQLEVLKVLGILPPNTAQCGLITKTDAERLVAALFEEPSVSHGAYSDNITKNMEGVPVSHECFGQCDGVLYVEFYTLPTSPCIVCKECKSIFTPQKFILHTHRGFEKRTCHWGFDPENWRSYLILSMDIVPGEKRTKLEKSLQSIKHLFTQPPTSVNFMTSPTANGKRPYESEAGSPRTKKMKEGEVLMDPSMIPRAFPGLAYGLPPAVRPSAFRPWSPCIPIVSQMDLPLLQTLPRFKTAQGLPFAFDRNIFPHYLQSGAAPVILRQQQPENERHTSPTKTSSSEVPNVCLAPPSGQKTPAPVKRKPSKDCSSEIERNKPTNIVPKSDTPCLTSPPPLILNKERSIDPASHMKSSNDPQRPVSRSREAAAAMLELKSAGSFIKSKSATHSSTIKSDPISQPPTNLHKTEPPSGTGSNYSTVVPLDQSRQHYKWTVRGITYIISAAGVQELDHLNNLINSSNNADKNLDLMHELVKMKARFEDKLDIKTRVKRDLEMELEHVKTLKKQQFAELSDDKHRIREDLENMRQKYVARIDELCMEKQDLREKLHAANSGGTNDGKKNIDVDLERKIELLYEQIRKAESTNDGLRVALHEERERRRSCEMKLEEAENSRGRLSFLMESPLARMVRSNNTKQEDANNNPRKHGINNSSATNYITKLAADAGKAAKKQRNMSHNDDEEIIVE